MSQHPQTESKGPKAAPLPVYHAQDLFVAENDHRHSSIGKMVQSINLTAPIWGFGTAKREDVHKMYLSKPLLKRQLIPRDPNTPLYYPTIDVRFPTKPKWGIANASRSSVSRPAYPHYELADQLSNPLKAFKKLTRAEPMVRFKSADRVT
jgi:hypothetical protein